MELAQSIAPLNFPLSRSLESVSQFFSLGLATAMEAATSALATEEEAAIREEEEEMLGGQAAVGQTTKGNLIRRGTVAILSK